MKNCQDQTNETQLLKLLFSPFSAILRFVSIPLTYVVDFRIVNLFNILNSNSWQNITHTFRVRFVIKIICESK